MTDPTRWADEGGDGTALEQDLFRSGQGAGMSPAERKRTWLAIAEQAALVPVGTGAAPHPVAGGAATTGLAKVAWVKGLSAVALLAGGGAGLWGVAHHRAPPATALQLPAPSAGVVVTSPPAPTEREDTAASTAPNAVAREAQTASNRAAEPSHRAVTPFAGKAIVTNTTAPSAAKSAEPSANSAAVDSRLAEEARAVLDVRRALASGNAAGALAELDAARIAFPRGALGQEREALTIEALAATGHAAAASLRATAFLAHFPGSPHASNVRRFVVGP